MAQERWVFVRDGKVFLHTENDGWSYLRKGPQAQEEEISLETVKRTYPNDYERVKKELKSDECKST